MHLLTKILSLLLPLCHCHQEVLLTSNSPAVLDAPITFYGRSEIKMNAKKGSRMRDGPTPFGHLLRRINY